MWRPAGAEMQHARVDPKVEGSPGHKRSPGGGETPWSMAIGAPVTDRSLARHALGPTPVDRTMGAAAYLPDVRRGRERLHNLLGAGEAFGVRVPDLSDQLLGGAVALGVSGHLLLRRREGRCPSGGG